MSYSTLANRLPDPNYKRDTYGSGSESGSGSAGPGFANIQLTSSQNMMMTRTNSQRVIARAIAGHRWDVTIGYHAMTQAEFAPVYAFLLQQRGPLTPFYVSLPQYRVLTNAAWKTVVTANSGANYTFQLSATNAGSTVITVTVLAASGVTAYSAATSNAVNVPAPGELININDPSDINHNKAYMITMVETDADNFTENETSYGSLASNQLRLTLNCPLAKKIHSTSARAVFDNPLIKVISPKAVTNYSLNTDNLYKFSLKLEEYL